MGREMMELRAVATLSRHNAPQDDQDNWAWNDFVQGVRLMAEIADLDIEVIADSDLPTGMYS